MLSWITWYVFVRSDHIPDLEVSQPLAFSSGWNVRSDGQNLVSAQIFNKLFTVLVFLKYFYISVESIFSYNIEIEMMCVVPLQYSVTSIDPGNRVISAVSDEQEAKTEEILHCSFLAIIGREEFKLDNKNNIYYITILKVNYYFYIF